MTLQANFGSHARVARVFAFDPGRKTVSVLWKNRFDGSESIETVHLSDLEAIDRQGNYADVRAAVERRNPLIVNPSFQGAA